MLIYIICILMSNLVHRLCRITAERARKCTVFFTLMPTRIQPTKKTRPFTKVTLEKKKYEEVFISSLTR